MKVIFLDIDGVLNGYGLFTEVIFRTAQKIGLDKLLREHYDIFGIHTSKVKNLARITKTTGAVVVISSSWRGSWWKPYEQKSKRQKELEDKFKKYGISVIDTTINLPNAEHGKRREEEIREWLSRHEDVESFVILDDEQFDLQGFVGKELVQTSAEDYIKGNWQERTGLKRKHVKQAIKILNKNRGY